jgi:hypothetical protein
MIMKKTICCGAAIAKRLEKVAYPDLRIKLVQYSIFTKAKDAEWVIVAEYELRYLSKVNQC